MKWQIQRDQRLFKINLPAQLHGPSFVTAAVDGHDWEIRWDASLRCFFVREPGSPVERALRVRNAETRRLAGEVATDVRLEYATQGAQRLTEAIFTAQPDLPGMAQREGARKAGGSQLRSPMTGKVLSVKVANGDHVAKGQELMIVEAMKMENRIVAPGTGVVENLHVTAGAAITVGQALLKIADKP